MPHNWEVEKERFDMGNILWLEHDADLGIRHSGLLRIPTPT